MLQCRGEARSDQGGYPPPGPRVSTRTVVARRQVCTGTSARLQRAPPPGLHVETVSRPVGGILSGPRPGEGAEGRGGHPSERPTWGAPLCRDWASNPSPTLGLAPSGVYRAGGVTPVAGALLPHPFTLTCAGSGPPSAVSFLWHCPAGRPDWPLASTLLCGVPTFLDTIPRAVRAAATRPTHRQPTSCHPSATTATATNIDRRVQVGGERPHCRDGNERR